MRLLLLILLPAAAVAFLWLSPRPKESAAEETAPTAFECRRATGKIVIDGKADEEAWKNAQVIESFRRPWEEKEKDRAARTRTRARLLWDDTALYFYAAMEDTDVYADVIQGDGMLWTNDVFELFFKPADDKPGYYEFQVNAQNAKLDMYLPRRGAGGYQRFAQDGDFHIESRVLVSGTLNNWRDKDEGWAVEGRIPWADFERTGGRPAAGAAWKFALCRYDYSVAFEGPDLSTCAPMNTRPADFHRFEEYATLKFVDK